MSRPGCRAAKRIERFADAPPCVDLRISEIAGPVAARQPHQWHATDDIEPGDGELRLEVPRRIVHLPRDRAGAEHDAERIDGAVVNDGTALGIGLVNRLEDVVRPLDHRQPGHDARRSFRLRRAITRSPLAVECVASLTTLGG